MDKFIVVVWSVMALMSLVFLVFIIWAVISLVNWITSGGLNNVVG